MALKIREKIIVFQVINEVMNFARMNWPQLRYLILLVPVPGIDKRNNKPTTSDVLNPQKTFYGLVITKFESRNKQSLPGSSNN